MPGEFVERRRHRGLDLSFRLADSFELANLGPRSLQRLDSAID